MVSQFGGSMELTCVGWVEQSETQHGAPIRWVSATASRQLLRALLYLLHPCSRTQPTQLGLD